MISVEYDEKTHTLTKQVKGHSDLLLFELNIIINELLNSYYKHGQEVLVLDEILDVVSEFAEKHTPKTKGDKKDD